MEKWLLFTKKGPIIGDGGMKRFKNYDGAYNSTLEVKARLAEIRDAYDFALMVNVEDLDSSRIMVREGELGFSSITDGTSTSTVDLNRTLNDLTRSPIFDGAEQRLAGRSLERVCHRAMHTHTNHHTSEGRNALMNDIMSGLAVYLNQFSVNNEVSRTVRPNLNVTFKRDVNTCKLSLTVSDGGHTNRYHKIYTNAEIQSLRDTQDGRILNEVENAMNRQNRTGRGRWLDVGDEFGYYTPSPRDPFTLEHTHRVLETVSHNVISPYTRLESRAGSERAIRDIAAELRQHYESLPETFRIHVPVLGEVEVRFNKYHGGINISLRGEGVENMIMSFNSSEMTQRNNNSVYRRVDELNNIEDDTPRRATWDSGGGAWIENTPSTTPSD